MPITNRSGQEPERSATQREGSAPVPEEPFSYDEVPYQSHPFWQTHPDRLCTIAALLGLQSPAVKGSRILELGCASGGNLVPMATALSENKFLGVDLSAVEVADGQKVIQKLGLKNIELRHQNILDVGKELGQFDYIICHGVYSWVPARVQERILQICKQNLVPNGVAYISYNTYPGWHMRGMIRDMMVYHSRQYREPLVRVQHARNLLDFLVKSVTEENNHYGSMLKNELEVIRNAQDSYLFHDHLELVNDPIYFYQFAERAAQAGLRYLGEADFRVMVPGNYPPQIESVLRVLSPDIIHMEQYMDFLRNRMFRQTLLCHKAVTPRYDLRGENLTEFYIGSAFRPVSANPNIQSADCETFEALDRITLSSREPLVKAAMIHLAEAWPRTIAFTELCEAARKLVQKDSKAESPSISWDRQVLGQALLSCYVSAPTNYLTLNLNPIRFALTISNRPVASPLARLQADTSNRVTSLAHEIVALEEFDRQLVRHLDGNRDRAALLSALSDLVKNGELFVEEEGKLVTEIERVRNLLDQVLDQRLSALARNALLMG